MSRVSSVATAVSLLLLGGVLAGCSSPAVSAGTPEPSMSTLPVPEDLEVEAAWLDGGSMLAVLTWGSSSCVPTASDVTYADGVLGVSVDDPLADATCTKDFVLRGFPVSVPDGVDPAQDLEIEVSTPAARGAIELAGVPGLVPSDGLSNGGVPTAGWTRADGVFAVLTWGSSGCRPTAQETAITAPGEITLTFAEPAADQVCTMDFVPRVTVSAVQGAEEGTPYELVLQGEGFAGARIPLVGSN